MNDFVGIGDDGFGVAPPVLGVTFFLIAGLPILSASHKNVLASWLDVAVNELPSFDYYGGAHHALGIRSLAAACMRSLTIEVLDLGQDFDPIGHVGGRYARKYPLEVFDENVGRPTHLLSVLPSPLIILIRRTLAANKVTEMFKCRHKPLRRITRALFTVAVGDNAGDGDEAIW